MFPDNIQQIQALTFDCYGTLIDWEQGILNVLSPWAKKHNLNATEDQLLETYAGIEHRCQQERPEALYPDILRQVQTQLSQHYAVPTSSQENDDLANSVGAWPAFGDSIAALAQLKQKYRLVILSNIDRASFALSNARLEVNFDHIITAQDVGAYKPAHNHFLRAVEVLEPQGIKKENILHIAQSLYHDHVPAKALGMTTMWINRRHNKSGTGATPPAQATPDVTVKNMAQCADMLMR